MKKRNEHDELFEVDDDPLWDAPAVKPKRKKQRERLRGDFYLCPVAWADRAAEVTGQYLILALRLYRCWQMRKPGANWIFASSATFGMERCSRNSRMRLLTRLEMAGLVKIVGRESGQAYRVQVIEPATVGISVTV
jgi:hypothetical protein